MTEYEASTYHCTKAQAKYEIEVKHGHDFSEFVQEYGDKEVYHGADVLEWLGY